MLRGPEVRKGVWLDGMEARSTFDIIWWTKPASTAAGLSKHRNRSWGFLTWALSATGRPAFLFSRSAFCFILNQGYWEETTESLTLVLSACVVCMGSACRSASPPRIRPGLYAALRPVLDLMQTLPTFVYLIPAIVFFGLGMVPGLMATVIFVLAGADPADLSRRLVDADERCWRPRKRLRRHRAGRLLFKVELPYAFPQIMAGLNQTIMLSLSMVVIAALVGQTVLGGAGGAGAQPGPTPRSGFESGLCHRGGGDHPRPDAPNVGRRDT